MKKRVFLISAVLALLCTAGLFAQNESSEVYQETAAEVVQVQSAETQSDSNSGLAGSIRYIAAALAVGLACIGGAMAVGKIGAAAMGAMSENAELSGKALPFVGLAEGICLWGFLVALFIIIM